MTDNQSIVVQIKDYEHHFLVIGDSLLDTNEFQQIFENSCRIESSTGKQSVFQHIQSYSHCSKVLFKNVDLFPQLIEYFKERQHQLADICIDSKRKFIQEISQNQSMLFKIEEFEAQIDNNYYVASYKQIQQLEDYDILHLRWMVVDVQSDFIQIRSAESSTSISTVNLCEAADALVCSMREINPDLIIGQDVNDRLLNFSLQLQKELNIELQFSRIPGKKVTTKNIEIKGQKQQLLVIPGVVVLDLQQYLNKNFFIRSNDVNDICNELKIDFDEFDDVVIKIVKLVDQLQIIDTIEQLSTVSFTIPRHIISHGQSKRVMNLIYFHSFKRNFFIPESTSDVEQNDKDIDFFDIEGGLVIEPKIGLYDQNKICVFDFQSLYPSIIIAHNICFSTLISNNSERNVSSEIIPFDTEEIGILPLILQDLIQKRQLIKIELLQNPNNRFQQSQQQAIKLVANSIYGITGMSCNQLFNPTISNAITAIGRQMLQQVQNVIKTQFQQGMNLDDIILQQDALIVYGDTDSIFVDFGTISDCELNQLIQYFCCTVNKLFKQPIKILLDKVFDTLLIQGKKKYAGRIGDKLEIKGLEIIRRDQAVFVQDSLRSLLNGLLFGFGFDVVVQQARQQVKQLQSGLVDVKSLILTKSYTQDISQFKNSNLPHLVVAQKMLTRNQTLKIGDKINYYILVGSSKQPLYQRSEEANYVINHNLDIDFDYYLNNQYMKPVLRLLGATSKLDEKSLQSLLV